MAREFHPLIEGTTFFNDTSEDTLHKRFIFEPFRRAKKEFIVFDNIDYLKVQQTQFKLKLCLIDEQCLFIDDNKYCNLIVPIFIAREAHTETVARQRADWLLLGWMVRAAIMV